MYLNVIMASGDMVAIGGEAVRILKGYPAENRSNFPASEIEQLAGASKPGLGSFDAIVMEALCNCQTEQPSIDSRELGQKGSKETKFAANIKETTMGRNAPMTRTQEAILDFI